MKFNEAQKLFKEHLHATDRSPKTISNYYGCLSRFNNYLSQRFNRPVYIDEIKADDFEKYLYEPPNDKNFSQATRYTIQKVFKSFSSFCYMKGYCKVNVGQHLPRIKYNSKERTFITEDELMLLADQINNKTDKTIMQTLFYTGLRIGEALKLTVADINFKDNYIYVSKRKSRDDRKIPINFKLRLILEEYFDLYWNNSDKVFVLDNGNDYRISRFNVMIKEASKKAGLSTNISSHIMRHSFASNLIAKGVDIVKVRKLLGHQSIMTTNIYLHTNMQLLRNAIDTL